MNLLHVDVFLPLSPSLSLSLKINNFFKFKNLTVLLEEGFRRGPFLRVLKPR